MSTCFSFFATRQTGPDGCPECECHECDDVMKHCTLSCGYGFEEDSRGCSLCKCKTGKSPEKVK